MKQDLSPSTQAILLLTAPLTLSPKQGKTEFLSLDEYNDLAQQLDTLKKEPADLLTMDLDVLLEACQTNIPKERIFKLLARGFQLSQALERWRSRAIWVISRADSEYPRHFKTWLGKGAPAVLYGCGELHLWNSKGLAVFGPHKSNQKLLEYATRVGELAGESGVVVFTGGTQGIEQAAMRGALRQGGGVCNILAESLEQQVMIREHRNAILNGQLLLCSPYDPSWNYEFGNAIRRSKLIYALSEAALIVDTEWQRGETWEGVLEQIKQAHFRRIYVRSTDDPSESLAELENHGAQPWPNPKDSISFQQLFPSFIQQQDVNDLSLGQQASAIVSEELEYKVVVTESDEDEVPSTISNGQIEASETENEIAPKDLPIGKDKNAPNISDPEIEPFLTPIYGVICDLMPQILQEPKGEKEIAKLLGVSVLQMRSWLSTMVEKGLIKKTSRPVKYSLKNIAVTSSLETIESSEAVTISNFSSNLTDSVRPLISNILNSPKSESEIATSLGVTKNQTRTWLKTLLDAGMLQKTARPLKYELKQPDLFSSKNHHSSASQS